MADDLVGPATTFTAAVISLALAIFIGLICFVRFLRGKSVAGGLFITTATSTAVFLGTSQFIGVLIPPALAGGMMLGDETAMASGMGLMVLLAQIGLFALWFGFLLFTIKAYVRPVGKIDNYLKKILDGEELGRVRLGKSKQYREIAQTIRELKTRTQDSQDFQKRASHEDKNPVVDVMDDLLLTKSIEIEEI